MSGGAASAFEPAYARLERDGELARRARELQALLQNCRLCPRNCGVNRLEQERGVCMSNAGARIAAAHPHFGEERALVGRNGSGTIFFSRCPLRCVFCQNAAIAHLGQGRSVTDVELAEVMLGLQQQGCHNINLVTPTQFVPNIVQAVRMAIRGGLRIPLVYNTGGYESLDVLRLLDGIIDIYLPDFKYADAEKARKYSPGVRDYPAVAAAAIEEMHRQVGDLLVDSRGIALRGLMVRHLVLPRNAAGTDQFVRFVCERLGPSTFVNLMKQYRPEHRAYSFPDLARALTAEEYQQALRWARQAGLTHLETA